MTKKISLDSPKYGEKFVYVDDRDYEKIKNIHWILTFVRGKYYAVASFREKGKRNYVKMHRLIMKVLKTPNIHIDHKDGDGLNNTRSNLRIATVSQNVINTPPNSKNKTGYKGVSFSKSNKKYVAIIFCNGKSHYGGGFNDPKEAAKKYNEMAKKYFGEFAYLNKIND